MNAKWQVSLLGIWVASAAGLGILFTIINAVLLADTAAYFPGDPPTTDILAEVSLLVVPYACAAALVATLVSRLAGPSFVLRILKAAAFLSVATAFTGTALSGLHILRRNVGEWAELKQLLRDNENRVEQVVGHEGGALSPADVEKMKTWFQEHPATFKFKAMSDPVQIRLLSNVPPYVGVDFGGGRNAVFDTTTMRCLSAD